MKRLAALLFLISSTLMFAQTQIDPTYQIAWNLLTGSGAPSISCTQNGNYTVYPYGAEWGQSYQDTTNNVRVQLHNVWMGEESTHNRRHADRRTQRHQRIVLRHRRGWHYEPCHYRRCKRFLHWALRQGRRHRMRQSRWRWYYHKRTYSGGNRVERRRVRPSMVQRQ